MGYYDDLIDEENQGELVEFEEIIEEDGCEQENPSETDYDNYVKENSKKKVSAYADEEENEIIKRAQADDQEAWNLIFKKYALFRHYLLYKMERRIFGKVTKEDLESYIDEGIVKAVREFDETKGNKFFTFLFITTKTRVMRLNLRNSRRYYQEDVLVQSDMNDQFVVSIDDKVGLNNKSEEGRLLAELIADTSDAERQAQEDIAEFALKIFALVKNEIAKDYFISKANEPSIVYNDIAKKYGITRSRVEQLVKRERNNILRQIEKSKEVYELLVIQKESIEFVSSTLELSESQIADYLKFYKHLYEHNEKIDVVEEKKFQVDNKLFYKYGPCVNSPILYAYLELCNRFGNVSIKDFLKSMGDVSSMGRFNAEIEKAKIKCGKLLSQAQKVYSYYTKTKSLARTADLFDMDAGEVRELFDVYLYFYQDGALSFKESGIAQRIKTMLSQLVSGPRRMNSFDMYNAGGTNNKSNLIFEDMFLMKAYELGVDISQEQLLRAESLYDKLDDFNNLWGCLFNDKAFEVEVAEGQENSQSQLTEYEKIEMLFPYNLPIRAYCKMQNGNATQSDDLLKLVVKYYSKSLDASAELISKAKENVESFILKSKKVGEEVKSGRSVEQIAEEIGEQLSFVKFYSEAYGYIFNDEIMPIENPLEAQRLIEAIDEIEEISKSFNCYLASIKGESVEKLVERLGGIKCAIAGLITRQKDSLNQMVNMIYNIAKDLIAGYSRIQIAVKSDISARMCSVYEREFPSILLGEKPHIPDFALEFDESVKDKISSIESAKVYRLRRFEQRTLAEIADETGMLVVDIKKLLKKQDSLVSDYLKQNDSESGFDLETAFNNCVSVNQRTNANRIRKKDKSRLDEVDLISLAQKAFPMDKGLQILKSVKVDGDTIGEIAVLCGIPVDEIKQIIENATKFVKELFTKVKRMEEARGNAEFIKEVFPNEHERSFYLSMLNSLKTKKLPARNPIQGAIYTGIVKSQEYIGFEDKSNILSRYYIFGERKDTLAENLGVTKWCVNDMIRKSESALQKVVGKFEQVYDAVTAGNPIKQVAEETNIPVVQIQNVYEYAKRLFFLTAENLDLTKFMNIQTGADFYSENKEKINTVLMKYKPLLVTNRMAEKYDLVLQNLINGVSLQKLAGGVAGVRSSLQGIKRAVLESVKSHMLLADSCHNVIEQGQDIEAFATTFNLSEEEVADYARLYDYFYFDGELPERFNMELKRKDNREESKRDKNNGSRKKEPGSEVGIQAVVDANNNTSNPQVDLDWSRVFENVSGLMTLIKPVDKAELCRVVKLFAHHYDKSPKAKTFRNVVYDTCVNKIPLKVVCENAGVNYLSCSAARSAYIREIKGHLTLCKVSMLAKKSSQSDLFYWLQAQLKLSDADIEQYSKLYSYVYDNGEDVDGWVPKSIARKIKQIEQKQQELEEMVKAELESRKILEGEAVVEIENGNNGNIEIDDKLQTPTPKQNECVAHMDSGEGLVDAREKETVVDGNVQPSDAENVANETLIHPKRKGRPNGSKNKKKGNPEGFFEIENS
ncbi:MAG: hypothetical protein J6J23_02970, partial [Clostridia bacterium]|nr:hypothetical protein [Clostridia bacterium]